jgi:hypothetical protein
MVTLHNLKFAPTKLLLITTNQVCSQQLAQMLQLQSALGISIALPRGVFAKIIIEMMNDFEYSKRLITQKPGKDLSLCGL